MYKERKGISKLVLFVFFIQFLGFLGFYFKNKDDDGSLIFFSIGIVLIGVVLAFTRLSLMLSKDEIRYRFSPFPLRFIKWNEIETLKIVKISALSDFFGWGIRYSKRFGKGYIIESDYALFITKKDGNKITISIQNKEKVNQFLNENNISCYKSQDE